jgi:superkiller protein 3
MPVSQAVALNANSFDAQFYLGRVQFAIGLCGAVRSLRAAANLNPRATRKRAFFLGTALEAAGESEAAVAEYQALVKADPDSALGQLGLGALLIKQGKIDEALAALQRAVAIDAHNFEGYWALGRA